MVTPNVMISVHDQQAMRTYTDAWTDMRTAALQLPRYRVLAVDHAAQRFPGLVIAAHGKDRTVGMHRLARNDIAIRIGYVTWILTDKLAFRSMAEAWEQAQIAGESLLPSPRPGPPIPTGAGFTRRRGAHRTRRTDPATQGRRVGGQQRADARRSGGP